MSVASSILSDALTQLKLADTFFNHSVACLVILDRHFNFVRVNQAYADACRRPIGEFVGHNHFELYPSDTQKIFEDVVAQKRPFVTFTRAFEFADQPERGVTYWDWTLVPVLDEAGEVEYLVFSLVEVTERKRAELELWRQANFDALTGLPNRFHFLEQLRGHLQAGAVQPLSLLLIDLDQFKEINDTLGHQQGDRLLREAAERIRQTVPEGGQVARLGGDEFTVLLPGIHTPEALSELATALIRRLSHTYALEAVQVYVGASVGIASASNAIEDPEALLRHADQAMFAAKAAGRGRFVHFHLALQDEAEWRMRLTNDLRHALERREMAVAYQPIIDLQTGAVHKAEALLRWTHPQLGPISPAEFIPLAEASGQIIAIGAWVLSQVAAQARAWQAPGRPLLKLGVNVSPLQMRSADSFAAAVQAQLTAHDLPPESLVLEITEGVLLDATPGVRDVLLAFRDAGMQVAVDDFGTGYSSLAYLNRFDIDYLKIDRAFVMHLEQVAEDRVLCEAIIAMAHKLGLQVVAEGVETAAQRDFLKKAGCDFAQGYLFSQAVPAEEFAKRFLPPDLIFY